MKLNVKEASWADNMNYFYNNPQLKSEVEKRNQIVKQELITQHELSLENQQEKVLEEEDLLKYVELRENKLLDYFKEAI